MCFPPVCVLDRFRTILANKYEFLHLCVFPPSFLKYHTKVRGSCTADRACAPGPPPPVAGLTYVDAAHAQRIDAELMGPGPGPFLKAKGQPPRNYPPPGRGGQPAGSPLAATGPPIHLHGPTKGRWEGVPSPQAGQPLTGRLLHRPANGARRPQRRRGPRPLPFTTCSTVARDNTPPSPNLHLSICGKKI